MEKKYKPPLSPTSFEMNTVMWQRSDTNPNKVIPLYQKKMNKYNIDYILNGSRFRCDEFTYNHVEKHILFGGCSVTFGEGVNIKDTWSYRLYEEISKKEKTSGYFNVAFPGASVVDTITNILKYIRMYGNPDCIFLLFPENERDYKHVGKNTDLIKKIIFEYYFFIDEYCKSNNIKLYSFSWAHGTFKNKEFETDEFLGDYFDSYYSTDIKKFEIDVYDYEKKIKNQLFGEDDSHPGNGPHFAWYNFIYDKYLESINDL
jgi:hypothetical protein